MRLRLILAAAVAVAALAPLPALADAPSIRATVLGGLERTDSAPGTGAVDGFYYGGNLGADWDLGAVTVGIEGELGGSSASAALPGRRASQGLFANAAVRVTLPVSGRARVFARGGYAYHEIGYSTGPGFNGSGYTIGGGGELDLIGNLYLRGEYRFSDYGSTVRGQQFLGGIGVKF